MRKRPSLRKFKRCLALLNSSDDKHRLTQADTVNIFGKMRKIALSMTSNLMITRLNIDGQVLKKNSIQLLVAALHDNTTITHLSLNGIKNLLSLLAKELKK